MKIDKDIVEQVLCDYVDLATRVKILNDIEREAEENKEPKEPKTRNQFVIVALTDQEGIEEIPMYITQLPLEDDHNTIPDIVMRASREFNDTPKGRKLPVETVGDAMESVTRKFFKERGLVVKTKEPVIVVKTKNQIDFPQEEE